MKRGGRRSAEDRTAETDLGRLAAPAGLRADELAAFERIAASWPPGHFVGSDADLLAVYVKAATAIKTLDPVEELSTFERLSKIVETYATKLRLTPQSRLQRANAGDAAKAGVENILDDEDLLGGRMN